MNYEEKYKEALEKARKELNTCGSQDCDAARQIFRLFPELAESKDEKVRKALIDFFGKGAKYGGQTNGVYDKDILAWLEKQGSLKDIIDRAKDSWYNEGKIAGMAEGLTDDEKYQQGWHDALENQGEKKSQRTISAEAKEAMYDKPAWSEEDVRVIDDIFYSINEESVIEGLNDKGIMYALKDIRGIVRYLRNWLQDLKRRVQPQPKQEWSEEDEEILRTILSDGIRGAELDMLQVNWLKSLRPQNRWKPSEDDIIILEKLIKGELEPKVFQATLQGILEQLKKLKEG